MTPLQKRKVEQFIDRGQYEAARRFLRSLGSDKDAQAMLADMAVTYPVTGAEKVGRGITKASLYFLLGLGALIAIAFLIGIVQFIQAQSSLR